MAFVFAFIFVWFLFGIEGFAATSSDTVKNYELKNCKLSYDSTTGQVKASWKDAKKTTDKVVTLYQDGIAVSSVTVSGTSADFTEEITKDGEGTYRAEVYPVKLGETYVIESDDLNITEEKLQKAAKFPDVWMDYSFDGAELSFDSEKGKLTASWLTGEKKTGARVKLFKGTTAVSEWMSAEKDTYDFTDTVASKGSGTYSVKVYPTRLGDTYTAQSEDFEVTSEMLKKLKTTVSEAKKKEESQRTGWYRANSTTNVWYYYKAPGILAKREWLTINEKTYHFSSTGIMQIGWQVIDQAYYCFDENGALYRNCKTPDGFNVNEKGQWVLDNGEVASAAGEKEAPAVPTKLKSCSIGISESAKEGAGTVKQATFSAGTGFKIDSISLSSEYENWKAGVPVTVRIVAVATTNYSFDSKVTFSARNCKNVKSSGNTKTRTVTFSYYPKMQLKAPETVYLSGTDAICWRKVDSASRYKVVITEDGESKVNSIVETNELDISDLLDVSEEVQTVVKIYAMGKKSNQSYLLTSAAYSIEDLYAFSLTNTVDGTLKWGTSTLRYTDSYGDRVTGWQQLFGYWYYFKKTGYAAGPGWIKDENGLWYYFDSEHHMCTGRIKDGLQEYFLNDGSVKNLPLGAWVKE